MGQINILNDAGTAKLSLQFTGTTNKSLNSELLSSITSDVQGQLDLKAPLASPAFSGTMTTSGTIEIQGGSGGPSLTLVNGGDIRLQDATNTNSVHLYCNNNNVFTIGGKLNPTIGTANSVSDAVVITVNTATPTVIASCTITTNGYPVLLTASGDQNPNQAGGWHYVQFAIDNIAIGKLIVNENAGGASKNCPFALTHIHTPPAGTYTFQLRAWQGSGSMTYGETGNGQAPTIVAVELR